MCKEKSIFWQFSGASVNKTQLQREICVRGMGQWGKEPPSKYGFLGGNKRNLGKGI